MVRTRESGSREIQFHNEEDRRSGPRYESFHQMPGERINSGSARDFHDTNADIEMPPQRPQHTYEFLPRSRSFQSHDEAEDRTIRSADAHGLSYDDRSSTHESTEYRDNFGDGGRSRSRRSICSPSRSQAPAESRHLTRLRSRSRSPRRVPPEDLLPAGIPSSLVHASEVSPRSPVSYARYHESPPRARSIPPPEVSSSTGGTQQHSSFYPSEEDEVSSKYPGTQSSDHSRNRVQRPTRPTNYGDRSRPRVETPLDSTAHCEPVGFRERRRLLAEERERVARERMQENPNRLASTWPRPLYDPNRYTEEPNFRDRSRSPPRRSNYNRNWENDVRITDSPQFSEPTQHYSVDAGSAHLGEIVAETRRHHPQYTSRREDRRYGLGGRLGDDPIGSHPQDVEDVMDDNFSPTPVEVAAHSLGALTLRSRPGSPRR